MESEMETRMENHMETWGCIGLYECRGNLGVQGSGVWDD